jgi:hypothetical protein
MHAKYTPFNSGYRMNAERTMAFAILIAAVFITTVAILTSAGQHPETLLHGPTLLILCGQVSGLIGLAAFSNHFLRKRVDARIHFTATLAILSLLLACALLLALPHTEKVFSVSVDDSFWLLTIFCMTSSLAGGFVLAANKRGIGWVSVSLAAIAQIVYFSYLLFASAMGHWH